MSNRAILRVCFLLALAGLWACWCDVALLWDGAYQLCCTLTSGEPFAYLSRFHSWVVWHPVTWLAPWTSNMRVLKMAYGLPYCLAPLTSVLLSWWVLRRTAPHLMIWSIFGAAAAPLPGQIFMINDSIFQMHLFWPVFFATLMPLSWVQVVVLGVISVFQLSHPIGIGLTALCAAAAFARGRWSPAAGSRMHYGWAVWMGLLALGGIAKLLRWPDDYAAREAGLHQIWMTFRWGVLWWPAAGLLAAWLAAFCLVGARLQSSPAMARRLSWAALVLIAVAGTFWFYWAAHPQIWQTAANYRRWLVPMSFPFLLAAGWEMWKVPRQEELASARLGRDVAAIGIALVFGCVLGWQSFQWAQLYRRLTVQVAGWPSTWIPEGALAWTRETPMGHWGLSSQIYVCQGQVPRVALLSPESAAAAADSPPRVALSPFNFITPSLLAQDWFRWDVVLQTAPPASVETTSQPASRLGK